MSVRNIIVESTGVSSVPRVKVKLRVHSFVQVILGVLKARDQYLKLRTLKLYSTGQICFIVVLHSC